MDWQSLKQDEVLERLKTDAVHGISELQAEKRRAVYGENKLMEKKKKNLFLQFLAQFSDFMVLILLAAAAISFVISYLNADQDYVDSIIILAIVVLNAVIGVIQESRAEHAIEALRKLSTPHARVIRSGKTMQIPSGAVVPGDVVLLETGDLVPADLRLLEATDLTAEESALTGESVSVEKNADVLASPEAALGDRQNMLFFGSSVSGGRGKGVVVGIGMDTQMGHIAGMINREETPQTPLQKRLAQTGKILGIGAIGICAVIFVLGLLQKTDPLEMFMMSVSLAVAAIPEGLPAVVTIVLAVGVRRMAAHHAIVRRLPAVETLGSASVICSDKTGTLTQNRMTVTEICTLEGVQTGEVAQELLRMAALCNNCTVENGNVRGEATEAALVKACTASKIELEKKYPRIREIAFSSRRKRMTTIHRLNNGRFLILMKGAPDVLMQYCSGCRQANSVIPMDAGVRLKLSRKNEEMAARALRVLGVAYRETAALPRDTAAAESGLVFYGFVGMQDPPRPRVADSVHLCKNAGIRPVMITGDHKTTAAAVAREIGILETDGVVLTGAELDRMDDQAMQQAVTRCRVFARVSPEHKVRIVKAYQALGETVAMTGDGVNDAPALKTADIGCAMGRSGTEVAKAAADLILTDDDFTTIVSAVREGRGIYENIRRTVHFLLSCNIGEILTVFASVLMRLPAPLLAIQLLWVNLVTDSLPALALGVEPIAKDVMEHPPVRRKEGLFSGGLWYSILIEGCLIGALSLLAYTIGRVFFDSDASMPVIGRTMAFAVLSLSQVAHTFNMRSLKSIAQTGLLSKSKLLPAAAVCLLLQISVISIPPLAAVFRTVPLSGMQWLITLALSVVPLVMVELERRIPHNRQKAPVKQMKKSKK